MNKFKATIPFIFSVLSFSSAAATVQKDYGYKPFVVTSSKLNKEMSDVDISEKLMCKSTRQEIAANVDLLTNYDLVGSNPTDGTMSFTYFRGKQGGKDVTVLFAVETQDHVLRYVWVDNQPTLSCG